MPCRESEAALAQASRSTEALSLLYVTFSKFFAPAWSHPTLTTKSRFAYSLIQSALLFGPLSGCSPAQNSYQETCCVAVKIRCLKLTAGLQITLRRLDPPFKLCRKIVYCPLVCLSKTVSWELREWLFSNLFCCSGFMFDGHTAKSNIWQVVKLKRCAICYYPNSTHRCFRISKDLWVRDQH